jgi:hypothetical protein
MSVAHLEVVPGPEPGAGTFGRRIAGAAVNRP